MFNMLVPKRNGLERPTTEGDSPVGDWGRRVIRHLSKTQHVKVSPNPRGPSRKAKYSPVTDSERVARAKDEKKPDKGSSKNLKPHAYKRWEPYARKGMGDRVPFA